MNETVAVKQEETEHLETITLVLPRSGLQQPLIVAEKNLVIMSLSELSRELGALLGPKMHTKITLEPQKQPLCMFCPLPPLLKTLLWGATKTWTLQTKQEVEAVLGSWTEKNWPAKSYAVINPPVALTAIQHKGNLKVKVSFFYRLYNQFDVLQWPMCYSNN